MQKFMSFTLKSFITISDAFKYNMTSSKHDTLRVLPKLINLASCIKAFINNRVWLTTFSIVLTIGACQLFLTKASLLNLCIVFLIWLTYSVEHIYKTSVRINKTQNCLVLTSSIFVSHVSFCNSAFNSGPIVKITVSIATFLNSGYHSSIENFLRSFVSWKSSQIKFKYP